MKNEQSEQCDGCGKIAELDDLHGNEFCRECRSIGETLIKKPELVKQICSLLKSDIHNDGSTPHCSHDPIEELPEVLDAVRHRTRDRELNTWYVSVSELKGDPVEIFASTAFDRDQHLQSRISNLTTITRLISLILRHIFLGEVLTLNKTIKQLNRSSRQKNDLPDMLTGVLKQYSKNQPQLSEEG
ncbi:MAG: hypothetical protein ABFS19_02795 [Thermodesulfobacteriota bacterium]